MSKVFLVSRCAWTLYNFRQGQMRAMCAQGFTVKGGGSGGDGFEEKVEALGVPFVSMPVDRRALNPIADLKLLFSLYCWYKSEKPQIVHHFTIKPVIYGSLAARLARVPRIVNTVTGLGYVFSEGSAGWLRKLVEWQYKAALGAAHFTFFQNEDDRQLFLDHKLTRPEKTGLLPGSGVDTTRFTPKSFSPEAKRDCDKPVRFVMVARMLKDKGVYEFVEAAKRVKAAGICAEFVLVGGRDERNPRCVPLEDLEKWSAEGIILWLGEVADVRVPVSDADVVVLPSFYREGTPRSLLEAAAMGKPIITTDNVGCREAVDHGVTGFLVSPRDAEALAEAMKCLEQSPDLRDRMGRAGREKSVREFDERIVIEKILKIYREEKL